MKSFVVMAGCLATVACAPSKPIPRYHVEKHQVYHFANGRVGYQSDDNPAIWYWLILQQNGSQTATTRSAFVPPSNFSSEFTRTPTISGGWVAGNRPTEDEKNSAEIEQQGVVIDEEGSPTTLVEAGEAITENPELTETVEGTISAPVEFGMRAEGQVNEPDETAPSSESSSEAPSAPSESSSSDSSGGGDSGGGDGGGSD